MIEAPRTWMVLQQLRANAWRSPERLRRLQDKLFRAAVIHAHEHVPFYRRIWDEAGLDARSVRGIQDLERIPIVSKQMIREAAERGELLARGVSTNRCTYLDTSGSSGAPLRILKKPLEERMRRAAGLRIWFEHGFRWRHVTAQLQIKAGPPHALQRLGFSRKTWISTAWPINKQLHEFLKAKPDIVVGTPTALRNLARAIENHELKPRPRVVFCAGELLDDETRDIIRQAFGVDPTGIYGQTEVGYVAWQCERRDGYHVNADTHVVEVLRKGRAADAGELGTMVATDLRARTMPLLRYDTTDLAIVAARACPCGRQLPILKSIEGRASSSVSLSDGRILTTRAIVNHLAGTLRLGDYRLYQETPNRFRLELVRNDETPRRPSENIILERLCQLLGDAEISIKNVRPWLADGTGKTHTIYSTVAVTDMANKHAKEA